MKRCRFGFVIVLAGSASPVLAQVPPLFASDLRFSQKHARPTVVAGSAFGYFQTQWTPWDAVVPQPVIPASVVARPVETPAPAPASAPLPASEPPSVPLPLPKRELPSPRPEGAPPTLTSPNSAVLPNSPVPAVLIPPMPTAVPAVPVSVPSVLLPPPKR